jgi:hypothetical protein
MEAGIFTARVNADESFLIRATETARLSKLADVTTNSKPVSSLARRTVPLLALGVLFLAGIVKVIGPTTGQTFDGLVLVNYPKYEFYPDLKECPARGIPYRLVPNDDLYGQMTFYPGHFIQGAWRVKFRGDLSGVGRYGYSNKYWRELRVVDVYEVTELTCGSFQ